MNIFSICHPSCVHKRHPVEAHAGRVLYTHIYLNVVVSKLNQRRRRWLQAGSTYMGLSVCLSVCWCNEKEYHQSGSGLGSVCTERLVLDIKIAVIYFEDHSSRHCVCANCSCILTKSGKMDEMCEQVGTGKRYCMNPNCLIRLKTYHACLS